MWAEPKRAKHLSEAPPVNQRPHLSIRGPTCQSETPSHHQHIASEIVSNIGMSERMCSNHSNCYMCKDLCQSAFYRDSLCKNVWTRDQDSFKTHVAKIIPNSELVIRWPTAG